MIIGTNRAIGKVFNSCIRPLIFTEEMGTAWLKHNIEEAGNFEVFYRNCIIKKSRNEETAERMTERNIACNTGFASTG
ncbi:MAG TPA: hypothetical protein PLX80_12475 [Ignavibacteria bacterium]|nr:hypothetical protein [Ignavibacteria bacterium]